jgi:hypothetical protein
MFSNGYSAANSTLDGNLFLNYFSIDSSIAYNLALSSSDNSFFNVSNYFFLIDNLS